MKMADSTEVTETMEIAITLIKVAVNYFDPTCTPL